jgi:protein-S-isoprenylcysteine O-methyltransferase Ste14
MRRAAAAATSAAFFALAPGIVAGLVPWYLTDGWTRHHPHNPWLLAVPGVALVSAGAAALVSGFVRYVTEGSGTPAPAAPTERLVVGGLNRWVRNPLYLAVVAVIVGQALILARPVLLAYATVAFTTMAAFVRFYEEPVLRQRFGAAYDAYCRQVPQWMPRPPRARVGPPKIQHEPDHRS